jgi:tyrosyl-tRNA synthetase
MNFVEELQWRGMIHNIMPGTEELLNKEMISAYVGIDPAAKVIALTGFFYFYSVTGFGQNINLNLYLNDEPSFNDCSITR